MAFWHVDYCLDDKVPQHRSSFASPTPPDEYLGKSPWPKSSITAHSLSTARQGFFLDVDVAIQHMASCHSPVSDKFRGLRSGSCFKSMLLIYEAKNGMFATVHDIRNPLATSVPESLQNPRSRQHPQCFYIVETMYPTLHHSRRLCPISAFSLCTRKLETETSRVSLETLARAATAECDRAHCRVMA